jgi:hypothetical protein
MHALPTTLQHYVYPSVMHAEEDNNFLPNLLVM